MAGFKDRPLRLEYATSFLRFLVSGCGRNDIISVVEIRPKYAGDMRIRPYFFPAEDYERAAEKAVDLSLEARTNLYVQCTLLKEAPPRGRGTKEMVAGGTVLWVDIDATPHRTVEQIIEDLRKFDPQPSWANVSGGGVHAYWKLSDFIEDWKAIEDRNRWLMQQLGKDGCWDATHILRIPGTANLKLADEPREVYPVEGLCSGTEYPLEAFPSVAPSAEDTRLDMGVQEEELPPDFLDQLNQEMRQRIEIGPVERTDRSSNDWFIARRLLELGFTSGQVLTVLTHPTWFSGEKARSHGYNYAIYTVGRAASEHSGKYKQNSALELQPVIDAVLIQVDEKGLRRKAALLQGSEFVIPAIRHLEGRGYRFYYDRLSSQPFIVSPQGDAVQAVQGSDFERWIFSVSGFTAEEREHRILRSGLASHIRENGTSIKLTPWCYHDAATQTMYVLLDQHGRDVLRIVAGKSPEIVPNGTDGVVLQKSALSAANIRYMPDALYSQTMPAFLDLLTQMFAVDSQTKGLLTCYALAVPLVYGYRIQTLPILHLTGPAGFGKSATLGMISTWLHGRPELLSGITTASAYRMADKEALLPFDDYEKLDEALKQFILTSATGATRHKSGGGASDTIRQVTHVLLALTSINPIEDQAARRRALVVRVDKKQHRVAAGFSETHWLKIAEKRSWLWSGYAHWLAQRVLPKLDGYHFNRKVREVEAQITVSAFGGLAGFIALMFILAEELEEIAPKTFGSTVRYLNYWLQELGLNTADEMDERNVLHIGLEELFEVVRRGPEGEVVWKTLSHTYDAGTHEQVTRVVHSIIRDHGFRLKTVPFAKLPPRGKTAWFGLEGSVTEWAATLRSVTRGKLDLSPANLGHGIANLIGHRVEIPDGKKESPPVSSRGYVFVRLRNAGPTRDRFGWRIMIELPEDDGDE